MRALSWAPSAMGRNDACGDCIAQGLPCTALRSANANANADASADANADANADPPDPLPKIRRLLAYFARAVTMASATFFGASE